MLDLVARSFPTSPQTWLDLLVVVSLKATVVLSVAALLSLALARASAAARHLTWSVALVGLLALPPLALWTPGFRVPGLTLARPSTTLDAHRIQLSAAAADESVALQPENATIVRSIAGEPVVEEAATEQTPTQSTTTIAAPEPTPRPIAPAPVNWTAWILGIWIMGAVSLTAWLVLGLCVLARLSRGASPVTDPRLRALMQRCSHEIGLRQPIELWTSDRTPVPCTWGVFRPRVLIPTTAAEWPADRLRVVLLHELAHVARRDCLMQMLAQMACALFWFHPLAWHGALRLRIERERACDDRVLDCDTQATDYADHLLAVVRAMRGRGLEVPGAVAFARPSQLEGRLLALLDARQVRGALTAGRIRRAVAVAAMVILPLALLRPWADSADADFTLSDAKLARPENGAASEVVQAPATERSLARRMSWALAQGSRRSTKGYWVAYAIPREENSDGQLSDSGPIDLRTLDDGWSGARMADVLAGRTMKDEDVAPDDGLLVLAYHFPSRGSRPEDVDRIRLQTMRLPADLGRQPLYWLGQVEDRESFDWARGVEQGARNKHLRSAALEALAVHADDDVVRGHLRSVLQSDASPEVRATAAERLARFSDPGTLDLLQATLHDDDSKEVRESAIEALGQMHSAESVRLLSKMARDPSESETIRRSAIEALGEKASSDEAMDSLEDLVDSKDREDDLEDMKDLKNKKDMEEMKDKKHGTTLIVPRSHGQDIVVLDEHGKPEVTIEQRRDKQQIREGERTVQVQHEQTGQVDQEAIQRQAVESLGKFPAATSLPRLVKIARTHESIGVRRQAIEALANLGTDPAYRALIEFAWNDNDEDCEVTRQAIEGIEQFDGATPTLIDLAKKHKLTAVRRQAIESLGQLEPQDKVIHALDDIVRNDSDEEVQRQAVEAISELPEELSLPRLEKIARSHPSVAVRRQAIEALGEVDPAKAAPILESLIKDK